jgi:hypothetical protein
VTTVGLWTTPNLRPPLTLQMAGHVQFSGIEHVFALRQDEGIEQRFQAAARTTARIGHPSLQGESLLKAAHGQTK